MKIKNNKITLNDAIEMSKELFTKYSINSVKDFTMSDKKSIKIYNSGMKITTIYLNTELIDDKHYLNIGLDDMGFYQKSLITDYDKKTVDFVDGFYVVLDLECDITYKNSIIPSHHLSQKYVNCVVSLGKGQITFSEITKDSNNNIFLSEKGL